MADRAGGFRVWGLFASLLACFSPSRTLLMFLSSQAPQTSWSSPVLLPSIWLKKSAPLHVGRTRLISQALSACFSPFHLLHFLQPVSQPHSWQFQTQPCKVSFLFSLRHKSFPFTVDWCISSVWPKASRASTTKETFASLKFWCWIEIELIQILLRISREFQISAGWRVWEELAAKVGLEPR